MLEKSLGRLEGVRKSRVGGDKFHYDLEISEAKTVTPSQIEALVKKLEDYSYKGLEITSITGAVEKTGEAYVFTARGSNQKYALKANEELKRLVAAGKKSVTLAGQVTEKDKALSLEVSGAKEAAK